MTKQEFIEECVLRLMVTSDAPLDTIVSQAKEVAGLVYGKNEDSQQSEHTDLHNEPLGMLTKEINRLDVELHKNGKAVKRGYARTFSRTCHDLGINSVQELLDFGSNDFRYLRHMGNATIDIICRALANLYNIKVW